MSALDDARLRVVAAVKRIYPELHAGDRYSEPEDFYELEAAVSSLRKIERGDEEEIAYREAVREMGFGVPGHRC